MCLKNLSFIRTLYFAIITGNCGNSNNKITLPHYMTMFL